MNNEKSLIEKLQSGDKIICLECKKDFYISATKDISKLDIGGIIVALYEIFNSREFIDKLKQEFIYEQFYKMVMEG